MMRLCKLLCVPSKAAILIIIWTATVGMLYNILLLAAAAMTYSNIRPGVSISIFDSVTYATLAIIMMFYPLSGFIADVCCGRLRTVVISFGLLICSVIVSCIIELIVILYPPIGNHSLLGHESLSSLINSFPGILMMLLFLISLLLFVIGLTGYQANYIQLGLDQLFEAQSHHLSLYIHYATWSFHLGAVVVAVLNLMTWCSYWKASNTGREDTIFESTTMFSLLIILFTLLLVSCCKYHWFSTNTGRHNPYKTVCKVLNYARKHNYPLRRSAFTFCDKYIPSRLDFAKERFGGPFPTEKVENVKTFLRILSILFAIGPVFMLEVPASYFIFPLFSVHTLHHYNLSKKFHFCESKHIWEIFTSNGAMMAVFSNFVWFPMYVWIVFSWFHNRMPRTFTRLGIGIVVCLLGVTSMLIIDVTGHALNINRAVNYTQCMFQVTSSNNFNGTLSYFSLDMHWAVLVVPSLFLQTGPLLVIITVLEFISAQSPQSMKGLLVGVFFAIRGLFQFLNSIAIIPLSLKHPWASGEMLENPPVTNRGFVYLLFTCVAGLIGLVLFLAAARRYKYRERNEGLFSQQDVEEIYDRYITQAAADLDQFSDDYSD